MVWKQRDFIFFVPYQPFTEDRLLSAGMMEYKAMLGSYFYHMTQVDRNFEENTARVVLNPDFWKFWRTQMK